MTRRLSKRKTADERFRDLIDEFFAADDLFKIAKDERERIRKDLLRKIRYGHRKHGVHYSELFAIYVHNVRRKQFSQSKARLLMGAELYNKAFKAQKYVQIDALTLEEAAKQSAKENTGENATDADQPGDDRGTEDAGQES